MLSGKVRWREVALYALFALVPAVSLAVLALSAVGSAEAAAQREVAAMVAGAAERSQRTLDGALRDAERALGKSALDDEDPARFEDDLRGLSPVFADAVAIAPDRSFRFPRAQAAGPAVRDAACDDEGAKLAAATSADERRASRKRLLSACREARAGSGRMWWPLVAIDALRDGDGDGAALAEWIDAHAAALSPLERRATALDVEALPNLADEVKQRIASALASPRSRRDDLARELDAPEARAAIERAQRSSLVVPWKSATASGAVRVTGDHTVCGYVVHEGSLSDAIAQGRLEIPGDLRAEVAASGALPRGVPAASVEVAPSLFVRFAPRDPGIVARQARRSRLVLGGVGIGSTLFACVLAWLLYRRMRAVERLSDLRTDFVSAVSHELRTPIASVRMLAELLEEGRVEAGEQAEIYEALAREARRLGDTVDRLLGFSRMAAGRYKVERRRANVASAVTASLAAFEEQNPAGPSVERDLDASIEADIDAGQIQLAVDNLLANAKKYAPDGGPYRVTVARHEGGVAIRVKDSGPGVEPRDQKRIFEPFERADDRLSRATEGSGIGLSLVAHVARAHGGRAWVESAPGKGATFHVWIPAPEGTP
ncbi:MAG: HAMP domain-containing sensor histidine kinase [Polyangiaceae bacterium]